MSWFKARSRFEDIFSIGIILKGIDGFVELVLGSVFLFVSPDKIHGIASFIAQEALEEDPDSPIASFVQHVSQGYTHSASLFLVIYLWIHAAVKLIAVIGIFRQKLWAYPFSLISLSILLLYQITSIINGPSIGMVLLSIFDIFILWLIWTEYKRVKPQFLKRDLERATE